MKGVLRSQRHHHIRYDKLELDQKKVYDNYYEEKNLIHSNAPEYKLLGNCEAALKVN